MYYVLKKAALFLPPVVPLVLAVIPVMCVVFVVLLFSLFTGFTIESFKFTTKFLFIVYLSGDFDSTIG